ncbi:MAC/perforin domain-containing protein [uncultured Mucilaginibacter sp.]|uniref:MAC/perforin domain-containing protein n=1 Tax=uncultured Mucilaginibacter sp. TaxID=797541 RepID=UPI0026088BAA|nr:MAC/perforin domain-containing protein [uncultured Mucilaginibacter sp.]
MKKSTQKSLLSKLVILVTICVTSCQKEITNLPKSKVAIKTNDTIKDKIKIFSAGDKYLDLLGYGYDITGEYANISSSRYKVIDVENLAKDEPARVNTQIGTSEYPEFHSGGNSETYSSDLSLQYTESYGYKLFKGTFNASFNEKTSSSSKYAYASFSSITKQKAISFNATKELIKSKYLSQTFKSDVNTMSPQQLVSTYGTHVLSNIILGAKLDVFYRTQTNNSNRTEAVKAGIGLNGLYGLFNMTGNLDYTASSANSNFDQYLSYRTVGGDGTKGLIGNFVFDTEAPKVPITIADWKSSCTLDNATLIQIGTDGLIPLYDLIEDPGKSAAVKDYITQYLNANQVRTLGDVPVYCYNNQYHGGDHYFTTENQPSLVNGWFLNAGISFYAFSQPGPDKVPIYVYYSQGSSDHYWSMDNQPTVGNGYFQNSGIIFYAYSTPGPGRVPVYMYYSQNYYDHYLSTKNQPSIGDGTYGNYGIAFYVP